MGQKKKKKAFTYSINVSLRAIAGDRVSSVFYHAKRGKFFCDLMFIFVFFQASFRPLSPRRSIGKTVRTEIMAICCFFFCHSVFEYSHVLSKREKTFRTLSNDRCSSLMFRLANLNSAVKSVKMKEKPLKRSVLKNQPL